VNDTDPAAAAAEVPSDLVTVKAASKLLAVHVGTVYLIIRKGQLRAWKRVGGHARVSRAEVQALMRPVQIRHAGDEPPRPRTQEEADSAAAVERLRKKGYKA
jgi:excisionase family DNA binding protein